MERQPPVERFGALWAILSAVGLVLFAILWEFRWRRIFQALELRQQTAQEWAQRALHDPLTSLPNRSLLIDRLEQGLARSRRNSTCMAVLFIDLDNFKAVNDQYGHLVGDRLLVATGERLRQHMRASDTAGRMGGDEFVVLLEMSDRSDPVVMIAERLRRALHLPLLLEPEPICLDASIGIALSVTGAEESTELLERADAALLRAKRTGKGQIVLDPASEQAAVAQEHASL